MTDRISILYGNSNPISMNLVKRTVASFPNKVFQAVLHHDECAGGDLLLALSYPRIVPMEVRSIYSKAAVLHASPVPLGRGWSPANWMLENLETKFTVSLLEMTDKVDAGRILDQREFEFPISGLWDSFSSVLEETQFSLIHSAVSGRVDFASSSEQSGKESYFPRRTPENSEINPSKSIVSQWGVIRAADPDRYPNYFYLHGNKYKLSVENLGTENEN